MNNLDTVIQNTKPNARDTIITKKSNDLPLINSPVRGTFDIKKNSTVEVSMPKLMEQTENKLLNKVENADVQWQVQANNKLY